MDRCLNCGSALTQYSDVCQQCGERDWRSRDEPPHAAQAVSVCTPVAKSSSGYLFLPELIAMITTSLDQRKLALEQLDSALRNPGERYVLAIAVNDLSVEHVQALARVIRAMRRQPKTQKLDMVPIAVLIQEEL